LVRSVFLKAAKAGVLTSVLKQSYTTNNSYSGIHSGDWISQSFTASESYALSKIEILIGAGNWTGITLTISLRNSSAGLPTGSDLTSGTVALGNYATATWVTCTVTCYDLASGTTYCIVVRHPGTTVVPWRMNTAEAVGTAGHSLDGGVTWDVIGARTQTYKIYGLACV
jgi:hypothetical protein